MKYASLLPALALLPLAAGQSYLYDAGVAGTPPDAPDPETRGWVSSGTAAVKAISPDPDWGINAWQINDSGAGSRVYENENGYLPNAPIEARVDVRMLAGSIYLLIDGGDLFLDSLFEIELELSGSDVLIHRPVGAPLVCPGGGDGGYHTFSFRGEYYVLDAYFDGVLLGQVDEIGWGGLVQGGGLKWGTGPIYAAGDSDGRARFHRVEIRSLLFDDIGDSYCGPAVPNSSGQDAKISAEGMPHAWSESLRLFASDLPSNQFGYFLASETADFVANPGGSQGNLCLGGNIGRFTKQVRSTGAAGLFWIDVDTTNIPTAPPMAIVPGSTWHFQAWFRDVNPTSTSNFTDGLVIQY